LSEADLRKVQTFKREFQPFALPEELLNEGLYIQGSDTTSADVERLYE
jgi:hypothetical protein